MAIRLAVLGCTGSIGKQALAVADEHPGEFEITALSAGGNVGALKPLIEKYRPKVVALHDKERAKELMPLPRGTELLAGEDASAQCAAHPEVDAVMIAVLGLAGLPPLLSAIKAKKRICIANKESIVCGGELVREALRKHEHMLYPIDSEQSAIFQCLMGIMPQDVESLVLTASGGAFRDWSLEAMERATPEQALRHPNWSMGQKITIDSATMINKGLEVIEAHFLFGVPAERIKVLIHPSSVVHGLVETKDGSFLAQLSKTDMRIAIQYALTYPKRLPSLVGRLNLTKGPLEFFEPDCDRFPGLALAYEALRLGGLAPTVYNAANEAAVELFLERRLGFLDIARQVEKALGRVDSVKSLSESDIYEAHLRTRETVLKSAAGTR